MNPERLAFGTVADTSETEVYTVPRHSRMVLASLQLVNLGSSDITVGAWVTVDDAKFRILPRDMVIAGGDMVLLETPVAVEANESLVLQTSEAGALQYYLSGAKVAAIPTPTQRAQ